MLDVTAITEALEKEKQREMNAANNAASVVTDDEAQDVQTRNGAVSDPFEIGDVFQIPANALANGLVLKRFVNAEDAIKSPEEQAKAPKMYFIKVMVTAADGSQMVKTFYPSQFTKRILAYVGKEGAAVPDGWHNASGAPASDYVSGLNLKESLAKVEGKNIKVVAKNEYLTRPFGKKGLLVEKDLVKSSVLTFEYA